MFKITAENPVSPPSERGDKRICRGKGFSDNGTGGYGW